MNDDDIRGLDPEDFLQYAGSMRHVPEIGGELAVKIAITWAIEQVRKADANARPNPVALEAALASEARRYMRTRS